MHNIIFEIDVANLLANTFAGLCNDGFIRIKTNGNILLAEFKLPDLAFKKAVDGVLVANDIPPEPRARATGKAGKYEIYASNENKILTGTVGLIGSDSDLELPTIDISAGSQMEILSYTHTVPRGN